MKKANVSKGLVVVFCLGCLVAACGGTQRDRVKDAERQTDQATEELKDIPPASNEQ